MSVCLCVYVSVSEFTCLHNEANSVLKRYKCYESVYVWVFVCVGMCVCEYVCVCICAYVSHMCVKMII